MATDSEIRKAAEIIREAIPKKHQYDRPLWQGVLDLIEQSDFGKKPASVEVESPLPPGRDSLDEALDGSFDGVQIKMLEICTDIFSAHGKISIVPYTRGLGTRSMTFVFEAGGAT